MENDDQIDALIKEIYAKNRLVVSRRDPIMIENTIFEHWAKNSATVHQQQIDKFKSEMEAFAARWVNGTRDEAEKMLNASLRASKTAMDQVLNAGGKEVVESLREVHNEANKEATDRVNITTKNLHIIATMNLVASLLTITAAGFIVWLVKFH